MYETVLGVVEGVFRNHCHEIMEIGIERNLFGVF